MESTWRGTSTFKPIRSTLSKEMEKICIETEMPRKGKISQRDIEHHKRLVKLSRKNQKFKRRIG